MIKRSIVISIILLFAVVSPALARSGCCSHHDGVKADGSGCNDGTPLSAICAPYYQKSNVSTQTVYTAPTPTPTKTIVKPTKKIAKPTPKKKVKTVKKQVKKIIKNSSNSK